MCVLMADLSSASTRTQFNLCVLRQQHVLAFDVSVDDLVLVEMGQTLQADNKS